MLYVIVETNSNTWENIVKIYIYMKLGKIWEDYS
jgi:hypothetical protein